MGALLSVNVGLPKEVYWRGKTVFTGVFEQRAVFVYQIDSYRYWERELGRSDFVHGQFGETSRWTG